jgi:hypothetical protein
LDGKPARQAGGATAGGNNGILNNPNIQNNRTIQNNRNEW